MVGRCRPQRELEAVLFVLFDYGQVLDGRFTVLSGLELIGDLLPFVKRTQTGAFEGRNVDKGVPRAVVRRDEAEAPRGVEKFYSSSGHRSFQSTCRVRRVHCQAFLVCRILW